MPHFWTPNDGHPQCLRWNPCFLARKTNISCDTWKTNLFRNCLVTPGELVPQPGPSHEVDEPTAYKWRNHPHIPLQFLCQVQSPFLQPKSRFFWPYQPSSFPRCGWSFTSFPMHFCVFPCVSLSSNSFFEPIHQGIQIQDAPARICTKIFPTLEIETAKQGNGGKKMP